MDYGGNIHNNMDYGGNRGFNIPIVTKELPGGI